MPGAGSVSRAPREIEPLGTIDIFGHSHNAETGASELRHGSMHKYASLFPARFRNLAVGGAIAYVPGTLGPASPTALAQTEAGWQWIAVNYAADDRSGALLGFPASPLGTTLTATTTASAAAGTTVAVADSTKVWLSAESYGTPVIIGQGATAEVNYLTGAPSGTGITLSRALSATTHASGEQVYVVPDAWLAPRQFCLGEWSWHDLAKLGPTEFAVGFKHALRSILAFARQVVRFPTEHVTVRLTGSGAAWSAGANTAMLSGRYYSTGATTRTLTIDVPVNYPAGAVIDLHFATDTGGQGAVWTITVDGSATGFTLNGTAMNGSNNTFDVRDQQGIDYGSTHASPTNGKVNCCTARLAGLAAGAHTLVLTPTTIKTTAYFNGWGIEAPVPPVILLPKPARLPLGGYAFWTNVSDWPYGGNTSTGMQSGTYISGGQEAADLATMESTIDAVAAEFDRYVFTRRKEPIVNPGGVRATVVGNYGFDTVHYNDDLSYRLVVDWAQALKEKTLSLNDLLAPAPTNKRGLYVVNATGGRGYVFKNGWAQVTAGQQTGFYLDVITQVCHVQGSVQSGTKNATMFTLPRGHRPGSAIQVPMSGNLGPGLLEVDATGNVYGIQNQSTSFCTFNFSFRVEG